MADEHLPIALRRTRRSTAGLRNPTEAPAASAQQFPARTPRRTNKGVRFSDPGPLLATGLTPMVRRTSLLNTPKRRRSSTPAKTPGNGNGAGTNTQSRCTGLRHDAAHSSHIPIALSTPGGSTLHQTLDGRVQRRVRRSNLRDVLNKMEQDKRAKSKASEAEIARLRAELKARDREIYELQNATVVIDTDRIWDLEQQVDDLKEELERKNTSAASGQGPNDNTSYGYNWTLAARDPFSEDDYMDVNMETNDMADDDAFGETTMGQLVCSTPSRARNSFPTPPATSPTLPLTPHFRRSVTTAAPAVSKTFLCETVGVQADIADPEKAELEAQLESLQREMDKLTATMDGYKNLAGRLSDRFASVIGSKADADSALEGSEAQSPTETLEHQASALLRIMDDGRVALGQLTTSINELGFPGEDAGAMIASLASGFRAARLELEYLTPGEISLPLTSHGAEVLDLLLTRLRDMARRIKEGEDSIDEYHALEQSLRKQLDARVSVMDGLKAEMGKAQKLMDDKNGRIKELEVGNDRLRGAVDGYVRDIGELEKLVERLEQEGRDAGATLDAHRESSRKALVTKDNTIAELEVQLAVAAKRAETLKQNLEELRVEKNRHVHALNKQQGAALALRDARVAELRGEIDRVNGSLRAAHDTICALRVEKGGLEGQLEEERKRAKEAIDSMKGELQRALRVSQEFLETDVPVQKERKKGGNEGSGDQVELSGMTGAAPVVVQAGGFLSGGLARRLSGKGKKRRHDSGLGLMNEDEVDF